MILPGKLRGSRAAIVASLACSAIVAPVLGRGIGFDGAYRDLRIVHEFCPVPLPPCPLPCVFFGNDLAVAFSVEANGNDEIVCVRVRTFVDNALVNQTLTNLGNGQTDYTAVAGVPILQQPLLVKCGRWRTVDHVVTYQEAPPGQCPCFGPICPSRRTITRGYRISLFCSDCGDLGGPALRSASHYRLESRAHEQVENLPWTLSNSGEAEELYLVELATNVPWLVPAARFETVVVAPGETIELVTPVIRLPGELPGAHGEIRLTLHSLSQPREPLVQSVALHLIHPATWGCSTDLGEPCQFACEPGAGACFKANATPACDDPLCCGQVCEFDPYCCTQAWDAACAEAALLHCGDA